MADPQSLLTIILSDIYRQTVAPAESSGKITGKIDIAGGDDEDILGDALKISVHRIAGTG